MRYMIIGPQGAGKTTFGKMLAEALGTVFTDTSKYIILLEIARQKALKDRYDCVSMLYSRKDTSTTEGQWDPRRDRPIRELLVALGDAINQTFPSFLWTKCFEDGDVAAGLRGRKELETLRKDYGSDVKVIYIDRPGGSEQNLDNFELKVEDADYVVRAKTLEEAKFAVRLVADWKF